MHQDFLREEWGNGKQWGEKQEYTVKRRGNGDVLENGKKLEEQDPKPLTETISNIGYWQLGRNFKEVLSLRTHTYVHAFWPPSFDQQQMGLITGQVLLWHLRQREKGGKGEGCRDKSES